MTFGGRPSAASSSAPRPPAWPPTGRTAWACSPTRWSSAARPRRTATSSRATRGISAGWPDRRYIVLLQGNLIGMDKTGTAPFPTGRVTSRVQQRQRPGQWAARRRRPQRDLRQHRGRRQHRNCGVGTSKTSNGRMSGELHRHRHQRDRANRQRTRHQGERPARHRRRRPEPGRGKHRRLQYRRRRGPGRPRGQDRRCRTASTRTAGWASTSTPTASRPMTRRRRHQQSQLPRRHPGLATRGDTTIRARSTHRDRTYRLQFFPNTSRTPSHGKDRRHRPDHADAGGNAADVLDHRDTVVPASGYLDRHRSGRQHLGVLAARGRPGDHGSDAPDPAGSVSPSPIR